MCFYFELFSVIFVESGENWVNCDRKILTAACTWGSYVNAPNLVGAATSTLTKKRAKKVTPYIKTIFPGLYQTWSLRGTAVTAMRTSKLLLIRS